jgi:hypothetical protein
MIFGNLYGVKMNVNYNDKNKFYNNFFNNTYNVNISANGGQNIGNHIFNASRTDGRNIIGQNVIGGNYWAKPDRSGYSQTCNDADNNKICDEKYNLTLSSTINIDYLPLTGEIRLGPYCGDTTCNNGETCSSCSIDCGTCSVTPGGGTGGGGSGGGSGGGGSGTKTCTPNWNCYWGICKNNIEKRICNDKNLCGTNKNKPKEDGNTRACSANAECIDNDGDGYGIGAGCLGEDLDDANSAITNKIIQEKTFMEKAKAFFYKYENYIIYSLLALAVIFILAVILTAIRKHKRKKLFAEMRKKKEERINQAIQLVDKWRKDGYNDLIIREMFKEKGWKDEDIEMIMM